MPPPLVFFPALHDSSINTRRAITERQRLRNSLRKQPRGRRRGARGSLRVGSRRRRAPRPWP